MGIFSKVEMKTRLDAIRAELVRRKVDVCLLHSADNVYYASGVPLLSGWGRPMWMIITATGPCAICGAMIEKENMELYTAADSVLAYADEENVEDSALKLSVDFIKTHVKKLGKIGVEESILPFGLHRRFQDQLGGKQLVEIGDLVMDLRIIKSKEELDLLELGGQIAKLGANAFLEALHENSTELSVAAHAVSVMNKALGALSNHAATSTYSYAQFAANSLVPHLHPTTRRLQHGDVVALNVFPVIWGYCMELERTFVFGEPSRDQTKVLSAVNEAFDAGKAAIRPGIEAREIDRLTRDILTHHGYGKCIRHGTGHAHGIMIGAAGREESGELRIYNARKLKAGMANSIEPGVYIPKLGGFRHSDVMFLTAGGARCVTEFPRDISYGG